MNTEKILIVGTGTMGEGIAQTFAQNGFDVRLVARREEPLARALDRSTERAAVHRVRPHPGDRRPGDGPHRGRRHHRHGPGRRGMQLRGGDHPRELLDDKQALSARHPGGRPELVIGSNTGSFTVDSLAEGHAAPENVIGIHYFNPAHIIPLVEIHRGSADVGRRLRADRAPDGGLGQEDRARAQRDARASSSTASWGRSSARSTICWTKASAPPRTWTSPIKSSTGFRFACLGPMEVEDMIGLDICHARCRGGSSRA